jgi:hypothetical protein
MGFSLVEAVRVVRVLNLQRRLGHQAKSLLADLLAQ